MVTATVASVLIVAQAGQVPAVEDLHVELDRLAHEVATGLAKPVARRFIGDSAFAAHTRDLRLASVWPRPEFREHLARILDSNQVRLIPLAARGLLNYKDESLRQRVAALCGDERLYGGGCLYTPLGDRISRVLTDSTRFREVEGRLLPLSRNTTSGLLADEPLKEPQGNGMLTVPQALRALTHDKLTIRLQAFVWLKEYGIVPDTAPFLEAWPQLSDEEREEAVGPGFMKPKPRLGAARLRDAYERIFKSQDRAPLPPRVFGSLLVQLATLDSPIAHDVAVKTIRECKVKDEQADRPRFDPLTYSFLALIHLARSDDVDLALGWLQSSQPGTRLQQGAYGLLASLDDPRAVEVTTRSLRDGSGRMSSILLDPLEVLKRRRWKDDKLRWQYIRMFLQMLQSRQQSKSRLSKPALYQQVEMIAAINVLTQTYHGLDDHGYGGRYDEGMVAAAIAHAARWVEENDPYQD